MQTFTLPHWLTDVRCEFAPVPLSLHPVTAQGALWQAGPGGFLLDVPDVGRYLVQEGRSIRIAVSPAVGDAEIDRFLRMTPLAALMYQRGKLAFHAAAVAHRGKVVLLAGDSGTGKSEVLACLVAQGWTMLADDLAIVDLDDAGSLRVWPEFPEIILWRQTDPKQSNLEQSSSEQSDSEQKRFEPQDAERPDAGPDFEPQASDQRGREAAEAANTEGEKQRRVFFPERFAAAPLPLHSIYWLSLHSHSGIEVSELAGRGRFRAAGVLAYNSRIADGLLDRTAYFGLASALARNIPIVCLRRPRGCWSVEELAAQIIRGEQET